MAETTATLWAARIDERWDFDAPADSEAAFRALLGEVEAAGDREGVLQLRTQIARAQALQRRFDDAHATLDEVDLHVGDETPLARVRSRLERGRTLNSWRRPKEALPLLVEAWDRAKAGGYEFYMVDAAHMIAIVSPPEEALAWNERALAVAQDAEDVRARGWIGSLCNNIGWTYHAMERYEAALEMFERALRARQLQQKDKQIRVAQWCVARCLRSLGRLDEALLRQRTLRTELSEAGEHDGYVHEEIGECLVALGRRDEAGGDFMRAYELLAHDPWIAESEPERIERWRLLAGIDDAG